MIIAVCFQKGGVAKTTTAAILTQAAARAGARPLAIDVDPQGNLSLALGAQITRESGSSYSIFTGKPAADQIQRTAQGLEMIPASRDLAAITSGRGSARRLEQALDSIRGAFDPIIIDTPATPGEMQYNALQAADVLLMPIMTDGYNIQSLYQTMETAQQIRASNPRLKIAFIISNFNTRTKMARDVRETIIEKARAAGAAYLGTVRRGVQLEEAALFRESLYKRAPRSNQARDYLEIFHRLTNNKYT